MGLFDGFRPNPDILCLTCGGILSGWQGKHEDQSMMLYEQGKAAPVFSYGAGEVPPLEERLRYRLPNGKIHFYAGDCENCGSWSWPSNIALFAVVEDHVWTKVGTDPKGVKGTLIDSEWLQCPHCMNATKMMPNQVLILCCECNMPLFHPDTNTFN